MHNKEKRVLWLYNHETLRAFEAPLLRRLGFEIYLPKIFPSTEEYGSCFVDASYDTFLTIPSDALDQLNQHDFYSKRIPRRLAHIMNDYFAAAIFGPFPKQFKQIVSVFSGKLFFHVFGKEEPNTYHASLSYFLSRKIKRIQNRFFFAQAYPFLSEVEEGVFRDKAITLPIGIPDSFMRFENSWTGGNGKLLFVCPRISTSPYYANIYTEFKKQFPSIPHLIAGRQFYQIDDPDIQGNLPWDKYCHLLVTSEVMFYHSEEPRHLHYHPLEAITCGLPLIYMKKGMLSRLVGHKNLAGGCTTFAEAKEKVLRVLQKDQSFIQEVLATQKQLLEPFQNEYCEKTWKTNFVKILDSRP